MGRITKSSTTAGYISTTAGYIQTGGWYEILNGTATAMSIVGVQVGALQVGALVEPPTEEYRKAMVEKYKCPYCGEGLIPSGKESVECVKCDKKIDLVGAFNADWFPKRIEVENV